MLLSRRTPVPRPGWPACPRKPRGPLEGTARPHLSARAPPVGRSWPQRRQGARNPAHVHAGEAADEVGGGSPHWAGPVALPRCWRVRQGRRWVEMGSARPWSLPCPRRPGGCVSPGGGCGPGAWAVGNLVLSCPPPPACSRTPGDARVWLPGAGGWWAARQLGWARWTGCPGPPGRLEPDSGRGVRASPVCGWSRLERRGLPGRVVSSSRAGWVVTMRTRWV